MKLYQKSPQDSENQPKTAQDVGKLVQIFKKKTNGKYVKITALLDTLVQVLM